MPDGLAPRKKLRESLLGNQCGSHPSTRCDEWKGLEFIRNPQGPKECAFERSTKSYEACRSSEFRVLRLHGARVTMGPVVPSCIQNRSKTQPLAITTNI